MARTTRHWVAHDMTNDYNFLPSSLFHPSVPFLPMTLLILLPTSLSRTPAPNQQLNPIQSDRQEDIEPLPNRLCPHGLRRKQQEVCIHCLRASLVSQKRKEGRYGPAIKSTRA